MEVKPTTAKHSRKFKSVTVTVLDQNNKPVEGLEVFTKVSGKGIKLPEIKPSFAITDTKGNAHFEFKFPYLSRKGVITFIVGDVSVVIKQK